MARALPELLAISDRRSLGGISFDAWLEALRRAGVSFLQLREKDLDDRALFDLARTARRLLPPPARVVVNGRLDVALAAGCDGVHLPVRGLPVAALRRRFGPDALIGCSTHNVDEVEAAARAGADYAVFGPVFPTLSKPGAPATGLEELRRATKVGLPLYGLGGVTPEALPSLAAAGAVGGAGIRLFQHRPELAVAAGRECFRRGEDAGHGA